MRRLCSADNKGKFKQMQIVVTNCVTLIGAIPTDTSQKFREKMQETAVHVANMQVAIKKQRQAVLLTNPQFATGDILENATNAFFNVYKQAERLEWTCMQYTCVHVVFTLWTGPELDKGAKDQFLGVIAESKRWGVLLDKLLFQAELDGMIKYFESKKSRGCPPSGAEAVPTKRARQ